MTEASDLQIADIVSEISPLCRRTETILILDDRVELARDLGDRVCGVHVGKLDMPPAEARRLLGPGPIIGVTANTAADILALKGVDVDYVGLGPLRLTRTKSPLAPVLGVGGYRNILSQVRSAGIDLPVVAIGGVTAGDIPALKAAGVDGVAVRGSIISAEAPAACAREVSGALNGY